MTISTRLENAVILTPRGCVITKKSKQSLGIKAAAFYNIN